MMEGSAGPAGLGRRKCGKRRLDFVMTDSRRLHHGSHRNVTWLAVLSILLAAAPLVTEGQGVFTPYVSAFQPQSTYKGPLGDSGPPAILPDIPFTNLLVNNNPPSPDNSITNKPPSCLVTGDNTITVSNGTMLYFEVSGDSCLSYNIRSSQNVSVAMMDKPHYDNWVSNGGPGFYYYDYLSCGMVLPTTSCSFSTVNLAQGGEAATGQSTFKYVIVIFNYADFSAPPALPQAIAAQVTYSFNYGCGMSAYSGGGVGTYKDVFVCSAGWRVTAPGLALALAVLAVF